LRAAFGRKAVIVSPFSSVSRSNVDRIVHIEGLLKSVSPAPRTPKGRMLARPLAVLLIKIQLTGSPTPILAMTGVIPLRELIDDMKNLRRP
jgi:hypothetical protein